MTSTGSTEPNFYLTPQQQSLLFAALTSNQPANSQPALDGIKDNSLSAFDYDFGAADSSFDFSFDESQTKMDEGSPDKSDSPESDSPDKRSHPDDDEDDEELGAKRRESEDKVAKKPGRKPLTTEPTTKRKAQNRAAQRAFRERKEKHLRDLEDKVKDLEKASEDANHENELLRNKIDKMTSELNEYKKRVSMLPNPQPSLATAAQKPTLGQSLVGGINDVNFQFEFPRFGGPLPGAANGQTDAPKRSFSASSAPEQAKRPTVGQLSPFSSSIDGLSPGNSSTYSQVGLDPLAKEDLANLTASLFSPPLSNKLSPSTRGGSVDSHLSFSGAASTNSPSGSSNANTGGASSSCGTSPEPFTQSPMGFKPVDTLTTIGEEQTAPSQDFTQFGNVNLGDFNWLPQGDFQFDPQLFGDYREPQENVLTKGVLDDGFFSDAFDIDFTTPYNMPITSPPDKKMNLIAQIDAAKNADDMDGSSTQLLTCNKIWENLQKCPKVQNGDFDLDGLCSELQKKAKCSGSGPVVDQEAFKTVMKKYLGRNDDAWDQAEAKDAAAVAASAAAAAAEMKQ